MNTVEPPRPARGQHKASTTETMRASMQTIWERVRPAVSANVDEIAAAVVTLRAGRLDEEHRAAAERAAHKITGSAGSFGFHRASELARDLESLFAAGADRDLQSAARAADQVDALRRELDAPMAPQAGRPADGRVQLLVVRRKDELGERIGSTALGRGLGHRAATDLASARQAIEAERPDVVLLDLSLSDRDGLTLLVEIDASSPPVPVLVLTGGVDLIDRAEAARAGATAFLPVTLSAERIVEAALAASERRQTAGRLLAVDDDPAMLAALAGLFGEHHLRLTTLSDPLRFWEVLEETAPDLLLLDLDMPTVGGLDLCRLVRADARWETLPILVLTGSTSPEVVGEVFAAGADDYVAKPVLGPELLTRVTNRLERVRLYRQMAETDPLTGLANRRKFETEVRRLRAMATRFDQPLSFALLDLDGFKKVNDQHGHPTGDIVLQRLAQLLIDSFRTEDVVARWGGEEIVLAMYGMDRDDGVARVATALEAFRDMTFTTAAGPPLRVTFSAGVGQFGVDGEELHELYRRADETMYEAKRIGGDRVLPVGWRPGAEDGLTDVVIVDDDPAMVALLTHALETRGHRTVALSDGQEALCLLTGPSRLRARVILLDVDLPGLSGLDVLAGLAREGVLGKSRVIMLTARSAEPEVLAALEQGVFDHVTKPFSVPVLMQRVRSALFS